MAVVPFLAAWTFTARARFIRAVCMAAVVMEAKLVMWTEEEDEEWPARSGGASFEGWARRSLPPRLPSIFSQACCQPVLPFGSSCCCLLSESLPRGLCGVCFLGGGGAVSGATEGGMAVARAALYVEAACRPGGGKTAGVCRAPRQGPRTGSPIAHHQLHASHAYFNIGIPALLERDWSLFTQAAGHCSCSLERR